ncbi:MAG: hypothetical protein ACYDCO_04100 [Armatimonadota bacterium]
MLVCDFTHSFIRWRIDTLKKPVLTVSRPLPMTLNEVRAPLDCRTVVTEEATGCTREIALGVSCKGEQVWVERDVWHQPNPDMLMYADRDEFVVFKRWDRVDKGVMLFPPSLGPQPEKQPGDPREAFDMFDLDLQWQEGRNLETVEEIIVELASNRLVISQTEYRTGGCRVLLEYPVKTVNFSERERYYQVDTGPVLLPDPADPLSLPACRLAYVAHNCPEWAEFIVNAHTPLTDEIKVNHYSQSERIEGTVNRMITVE